MTTARELTNAVNNGEVFAEGDDNPVTEWQELATEDSDLSYEGKPLEFIQSGRTGYDMDYWETLYKYDGLYYTVGGRYSSWDGVEVDPEFYAVDVKEQITYVTVGRKEA